MHFRRETTDGNIQNRRKCVILKGCRRMYFMWVDGTVCKLWL